MMLTILDQLWVWMGLRREELRKERGRGVVYAILFVSGAASLALALDLMLNLSGRFG